MFAKFMCSFFVIMAADGASLSGKCPLVKHSLEPDLDKLSGLWHVVGGIMPMEFKRDGAKYTITSTYNETLSRTIPVAVGVDDDNRKVLKVFVNQEHHNADNGYLLAAEYDKFAIIYSCQGVHDFPIVLSRSKDVDDDTEKKIKNVLPRYPQHQEPTRYD